MNRQNYELVWSALPFPAFVIGEAGQVEDANSMAENLIARSKKQMAGKPIADFIGEGSIISDTLLHSRSRRVSLTQHNVSLSLNEKEPVVCNIKISPLSVGQERSLLILQPTTIAEQMSRSLNHLSAARSVSGMAAMLAHEIRNPLAGISGAAQLLTMNANPEDRELGELIQQEIKRVGQLVDRVEHFGDQRPIAREPLNIHDIIDRALRAAKAGFAAHVSFDVDFDPSLPDAVGDPNLLLQVFQNLIKNAAESVDDMDGNIIIRTSYTAGIKLSVSGGRSESLPLQIDITDNGKGIPASLIGDIFDPFVSSKTNGTGLGLSLVSKIIADHGGMIECASEPGRTNFRIRLPLWRAGKEGT